MTDKIKKVLVCDDDLAKIRSVQDVLSRLLPNASIKPFRCANAMLSHVLDHVLPETHEKSDTCLVVTDMNMPYVLDGQNDPEAGLHVLAMLENWGLDCPAVVVSSDKQNGKKLKDAYGCVLGSVIYGPFTDMSDGMSELIRKIN